MQRQIIPELVHTSELQNHLDQQWDTAARTKWSSNEDDPDLGIN